MRMSDLVAQYIQHMLDESDGNAEIQRNELAGELGCVPSQINYVITSRFTPEQGYIVESKRGGGGYIRIQRIKMDRGSAVMHLINAIGAKLDGATAQAMLNNMQQQGMIAPDSAKLMASALSEKAYRSVPPQYRDYLRASLFKNMLLTQI
ncbi:MAG: CtsR family transcriptional regulator [Clostridiales bacterium]|nr:CtsR family transcriptional regulator [Clostridiales bacterium]